MAGDHPNPSSTLPTPDASGGTRSSYHRSIFGSRPLPSEAGGRPGSHDSPKTPESPIDPALLQPRRRRLSFQGRLVLFSVLVLAFLVAIPTYLLTRPEKPYYLDSYQVATVGVRDFRQTLNATGKIEPYEVLSLKSPAAALVRELNVATGDDVQVGQLLLRLDSAELEKQRQDAERELQKAQRELQKAQLDRDAELGQLQLALGEAKNALTRAESNLPVQEQLYKLGGVPLRDVESARQAIEQQQEAVRKAQEALAAAERRHQLAVATAEDALRLSRLNRAAIEERWQALSVRSPQAGRVLSLPVRAGQAVSAGTELLQMADIHRMQVNGQVPADQASWLTKGMPATVWAGGRQLPARLAEVAPQATAGGSQESAMVAVRFEFSGGQTPAELGILPYTDATCEVEVGRLTQQPYLPRGPFLTSGEAGFVYVVDERRHVATRREVTYGLVDGTAIQVRSGLQRGDQIIYSSYDSFRDRQEIRLAAEGARPVQG